MNAVIMKRSCCAGKNCASRLPVNCSFDCAQVYPSFFKDCGDLI